MPDDLALLQSGEKLARPVKIRHLYTSRSDRKRHVGIAASTGA
jgi:hypothetical protein